MKAYLITKGEFGQLFGVGVIATICFSLGVGLFGFALDVTKDLSFAPGLPEGVTSFWDAVRTFSWYSGGFLLIAGVGIQIWRHIILSGIKKETIFPES